MTVKATVRGHTWNACLSGPMGTEGISLWCWGDLQRPQVLRASKQEILLNRVEATAAGLGKEALSALWAWSPEPSALSERQR